MQETIQGYLLSDQKSSGTLHKRHKKENILHEFNTQKNQAFNTIIMKYKPKGKHYYSTLSITNFILIENHGVSHGIKPPLTNGEGKICESKPKHFNIGR